MNKKEERTQIFSITLADLQRESSQRLGRRLNNVEIEIAKKGIENGLQFDIDTIYNTIFYEMLEN
ncbi:MAG: hypothetical protein K8I03_02810 [Ignavibacteria bacterium]|nr:hypothetical protein [Ignavibacteria bacterium]